MSLSPTTLSLTAADRLVPQDLQKHLKNSNEVEIFNKWQQSTESTSVQQVLERAGESHFDRQRAAFVPRRSYHDLERYVELCVGKDRPPSTWQDAVEQADAAERKYKRDNTDSGFGKFMQEKGSSWATDLAPLKALFPEDHGLNVIAGGLSLIFHGVSKIAANREKIFSFFKEVPVIAEEATKRHKYLTHHYVQRDVITLDDRLEDLCQSVINGLCGLIRIVQPREKKSLLSRARLSAKASPRLESIFQVDSTAGQIDLLINEVKQSRDMLNECAKTLEAKLSRDNLLIGKESLREIKATRKTLHDGWQDTRSLSEEALREAKGLQRGVDHLAYTLTMDRVERNHTQTEFYNIIMNTIRTMQHDYESLNSSLQINAAVKQSPSVTVNQLLDLLQVHPEAPGDDLIESALAITAMEDEAQQLAGKILNDEAFRNWLFSTQSACLLIEEMEMTAETGGDSPFAMFLGMFISSLRMLTREGHEARYASCFFCGMHSNPSQHMNGPSGMMRSLIAQLIFSISEAGFPRNAEQDLLDLSFLDEIPELLNAAARQDVAGLCDIYIQIVNQISRNATVVCLIDGVENFENDAWRAEMCYLVERLQQMARLKDGQSTFKLCLTSSGTAYIGRYFAPEEYIIPGSTHFGSMLLDEDSFKHDLEDADLMFSNINYSQSASNFGDTHTDRLRPHDGPRQYGKHSRGSSPSPSYHSVRLSPSNPDMHLYRYY